METYALSCFCCICMDIPLVNTDRLVRSSFGECTNTRTHVYLCSRARDGTSSVTSKPDVLDGDLENSPCRGTCVSRGYQYCCSMCKKDVHALVCVCCFHSRYSMGRICRYTQILIDLLRAMLQSVTQPIQAAATVRGLRSPI